MENWETIKGYERYSVSNHGRVMNNESKVVISSRDSNNGYLRVNLRKGDVKYEKPRVIHVHRLVALAFIDNVFNKPQVNHIDGDKHNNNVDNLEWVTSSENIEHAYKTELLSKVKPPMTIEHRKNNVESHNRPEYRIKMQRVNREAGITRRIKQIDRETGVVINRFDNAHEAARFLFGVEYKFKDRLISRVARGSAKSAYGFIWRYE